MSRRITILGLTALCALALGAVSASTAFGATTAFTCVSGGTAGPNNFSDADCSTVDNASGTFGHTAIAANTPTTLTLANTNNWVLEGRIFGNVKIEMTGVECTGCTVENKEVGGVMEVTGGGKLKFTGVTLVGLPACTVVGSAPGVITTEALKFTTTSNSEVVLEPNAAGGRLATFDVTGATCVVSGTGIRLTGKIKTTLSGAKLNVNVLKATEELKLEEEKASLKGAGTLEAGTGATHHPLSLT